MKAMVMTRPGEPEVLQPAQLPLPSPAGREILVRLHASGVNPVDTKLRSRGTYYPERMPAVLGCDGAGVVEATGPEAQRFKPGDRVFFCNGGIGGQPGTYAEYAVLDEAWAAAMPETMEFAEAAAAPLVLITAWESLHERARIQSGQTVLIHAGAGGVGHVAIQLAKAAGCRVLTTVGSPEKAAFVRGLGADAALQYRDVDFVQAVLDLTGCEGVDVVFDTVGGKVFERSFAATRPYGDVVSLLQPGADTDWKLARMRNLRVSLELMLSPMYYGWREAQAHQAGILERGAELFKQGALRIQLSHILPLEQAAQAHRLIEAGGMMGKVVLLP